MQAPCLLVAVDDFFTVRIPKLHPVAKLFTLAGDTAISDAEKQRIAPIYQGKDWRALARGSSGWHAVAGAPSEAAAVDQAIELCAASDRDCHLYAIGDFRVGDES